MKDLKTAIVIFAHSAEYEATLKPFQHSKEVFESLNQRTLDLVKKTNLPYFVFTEKEQFGTTFGERFTNALTSVYNSNFDSLIVIGNDTPDLTLSQLVKAKTKLAKNEIVLGSSIDGGFYLLGIKKEHFNPELFLKLPWQSQKLNASLSKLFKVTTTKVFYLKKLLDIDSIDDIKKLINNFRKVYDDLFKVLLLFIKLNKRILFNFSKNTLLLFQSKTYNKGSPISI